MEKFKFTKKYQDRDYLYNEYVTKNRSSKDIGKELHISYKLVEIWLAKFDISIRQVLV
jgi:transposase